MSFLKIKVGDIIADKENQKILKELFNKKKKKVKVKIKPIQDLIDSLDTKIKGDFYNTNKKNKIKCFWCDKYFVDLAKHSKKIHPLLTPRSYGEIKTQRFK